MARGLEGKTVVITGSRKTDELSAIIEKQGGIALVRPQQGTLIDADQRMGQDLLHIQEHRSDWMIFTTGGGLDTMLSQAERIGIRPQLLDRIGQAKVAARGYKTFALLKKNGITPVVVDEDGTVQGLIHALQDYDFAGQDVMVQLHGEPSPPLIAFLQQKGANVRQVMPYLHIPPDSAISLQLCEEIADGHVDAVCFTAAIQVRFFFEFARNRNLLSSVKAGFEAGTLAVAVGKVTAEALREQGIERIIAPENERMGAMIIELARYYGNQN
ncbi:uroporphyrinogen-III synthase [Paenibacillus nasutitermitis]|uniref:Tetrapyrrole biosynthesis uroporphyrinogen III synthase domain-containing protein n=1 Tax=Paenibacillus nasutitermitis TaxID=1652958 RepID=A0A917DNQ4_9BACL|nr:uroporphyrinogen-III synthase [Paenibacillus nasutitermitis]GGD55712.1 hypothetical protein GCM10010911_11760 [Paenibacillus nasutitermitis]